MKTHSVTIVGFSIKLLVVGLFWFVGTSKVFAEIEIDLDEASKPTSTPVAKFTPTPANASHKKPAITPTPSFTPIKKASISLTLIPTPTPEKEAVSTEPEKKPEVIQGVLKMKDVYAAGIQSYKEKDYDEAINYLTKAVKMKDKYTPKYFYAEAYATLGVIYQYHIIRYKTAYDYYQKALKCERNNKTAKKHIKEVKAKLRKRK